MSKVTLKPGDYVRTEGMTEEQYHSVVKEFVSAGARDKGDADFFKYDEGSYLGYDERNCELWNCGFQSTGFRNELTIAQILGAEKGEPPMTIEQLLAKANHHAAKAAKHERKRQALVEQADRMEEDAMKGELEKMHRVYMEGASGHDGGIKALYDAGYRLVATENDQPTKDMTNPKNWKAGDVVECVIGARLFTEGKEYALTAWPSTGKPFMRRSGNVSLIDDVGDDYFAPASCFRWLRRPSAQGEE